MKRRTMRKAGPVSLVCGLALAACGGGSGGESGRADAPADDVRDRMSELQEAVTDWSEASSIEAAHSAAEAAANLVVGPEGPGYSDRDEDGVVQGESDVGLLSGLDGDPVGLAATLDGNECVTRDVLGSTADDPSSGWEEMAEAIDAWRPDNNTMPTLASHPMRIVGWATFTLGSADLDEAHEFAGHAQLHIDVASDALDCA